MEDAHDELPMVPVWAPTPAAPARRSEVFVRLAKERMEDNPEEAANLALKAIEAARAEDDELGSAVGMLILSEACYEAGHDPEEILRPIRFAVDTFTAHNDNRHLAESRLLLATIFAAQCVFDEAAVEARAALGLAKATADTHLEIMCDLRLATILLESSSGGHDDSRRQIEKLAERFRQLGDIANAARALFNLANSSLEGDARESARIASRAIELCGGNHPGMLLSLHLVRAEAASRLGWIGVAGAELAEAEKLAIRHPQPAVHQIGLSYARAMVLRVTGSLEAAHREFIHVIHRATTMNDHFLLYHANNELATVCEMQGDYIGALGAARAQHTAHVALKKDESVRRLRMLDVADRIESERLESDKLRSTQVELERAVGQARSELAQAEQILEWERSRRALVEFRAARNPGIEPITGLPNLSAVTAAVTKLLDSLSRVAVVVITADEDRLLAPMPDMRQRMIQELSARVHAFIKQHPGAVAGALGSDDLVAVIPIPHDTADLSLTLNDLHAQLSRPIDVVDRSISVTVQLGVAVAPDHGIRGNALLSRARLAAQAARRERPHTTPVAVFEASVEHRQQLRTFVHERLDIAMAKEHLALYYQPIVNAATGKVTGAEALVRWFDPEKGLITPNQFIPLAEETGQIVQLGGYVLQRACREAASWSAHHGRDLSISVNVSAAQIVGGTILNQVENALMTSGLRPDRLALELTESTLATHGDAINVLQTLRDKGIRVEIDDFGTGYSSFSYLTRFPVDTVKIDKSFVDRIATGVDDAAITKAIISMAHSLRLTVIAEGIEHEDQAFVLREQGCDEFQGWLYQKALPASDFVSWLRSLTRGPTVRTDAHAE
jgi:EAL domain-containing protein (putative c-di-GMP-specific phosphodiesterase class I)/GGDEF domain-containing protein